MFHYFATYELFVLWWEYDHTSYYLCSKKHGDCHDFAEASKTVLLWRSKPSQMGNTLWQLLSTVQRYQSATKVPRAWHTWKGAMGLTYGNLRGPQCLPFPPKKVAGLISGIIKHHHQFRKALLWPYFPWGEVVLWWGTSTLWFPWFRDGVGVNL